MGWLGSVDAVRLFDIMAERDTDYLVIYRWQSLDSPFLFESEVEGVPSLFERRASWEGVSIF